MTAVPTEAATDLTVPSTGAETSIYIFKVECKPGQAVKAGDVLVVLEAMKMEIEEIGRAHV